MVKQQGNKMKQAVVVGLSWVCLGFVLAEGVCLPDAQCCLCLSSNSYHQLKSV